MRPILRTKGISVHRAAVGVLAVLMAALPACAETGSSASEADVSVAASFYPLAYAAEQVGGTCVEVTNLTPPGTEPHDLELTPDDVEAVATADLVVYLGGGFQPAVQDAIEEAQGVTLDLLAEVDTAAAPSGEADGLSVDPHVWLDPGLFATAIPPLVEAMESAAPDATCDFHANGAALIEALHGLDAEFVAGLADCRTTTLVTNHAAFGYLASAYGLTQSAISGLAPDTEPTPDRIAELVDLVHREGVTTVFSEALVSPEVAQTLANEADVQVAVLDTLEGLTPDEVDAGQDYGSVMRRNLETLRGGLDCR
jgi:zinc transport system substrate-binding protein